MVEVTRAGLLHRKARVRKMRWKMETMERPHGNSHGDGDVVLTTAWLGGLGARLPGSVGVDEIIFRILVSMNVDLHLGAQWVGSEVALYGRSCD